MVLKCDLTEAGYSKGDPVLKDISFSIQPWELVGLIGPNGAGKSSTIKSLLGVIEHIEGHVELEDYG